MAKYNLEYGAAHDYAASRGLPKEHLDSFAKCAVLESPEYEADPEDKASMDALEEAQEIYLRDKFAEFWW